MNIYPLKLSAVPKNIIWGGTKLRNRYGKTAPFDKIAESWELTVRDDGMSFIENGVYVGRSLEDYISENPTAVGIDRCGNVFPLLIKFIDACDDLSIQVHPDDNYAETNDGCIGKTEMWYVIDADPDAALVYGLRDGISKNTFTDYIKNGTINDALNRIEIKKGEVYFIPAGQVHAICRGALIAEIQQNSNVTYRIYDYDRIGTDGKKRELHTDKALNVVRCYTKAETDALRFCGRLNRRAPIFESQILADCEFFRVSKIKSSSDISFTVDEKSFISLLFTDADRGVVSCGGVAADVSAGDSIFIPAGAGEVSLKGNIECLISEI